MFDRSMFGQGDIMEDLLEAAASGAFDTIEGAARSAVDSGMTDCPCGKPGCKFGKAIRAEVDRRRSGSANALTAAEVEEATYQGYIRALLDFERERRERSIGRRFGRFAILLGGLVALVLLRVAGFLLSVVTTPYTIIMSAIKWRDLEAFSVQLHGLLESFGATAEQARQMMPWRMRWGYKIGKRLSSTFRFRMLGRKPAPDADPVTDAD